MVKEKDYNFWVSSYWRPACAWTYLLICVCDFIIFPILFTLLFSACSPVLIYTPLTLSNGGIFHISFGSIITLTSYSRMKEKLMQNVNSTSPTQL